MYLDSEKILSEGGTDIRLIPTVVSGDPNDRRSIVVAKSIPCKKYGINTAEHLSMALRKCPNLVVVHGDWSWYRRCSDNFIAICRTFSPVLQQFSIDECFLEMTDRLKGRDPIETANDLREHIKRRLGFTVNIGIGSNKLLAKMASDFEKPDKVHTLWSEEVMQKMWPLPVRDLLWVGKKTEERLNAYGIDTIGKLAQLKDDLTTIKKGTERLCIQMSQEWETVWPAVNEGPFVFKKNGIYYLTYSANSYESIDYGIGFATSDKIGGIWTKYEGNPVFQKPAGLYGVGHHAFFKDSNGKDRIVFHSHNGEGKVEPRIIHISSWKVDRKGVIRISEKDIFTAYMGVE